MSQEKKRKFKATIDGKEIPMAVERPDTKRIQKGQQVYNEAYWQALQSHAIVRIKLDDVMREQGLWDEEKEKSYIEIQKTIADNLKKIADGNMNIEQAKNTALEIRGARLLLRDLISRRNALDANTAEAQAETARFNYLVSVCVVYDDEMAGRPYFKNVDDYLAQADTEVARKGAELLAMMNYGVDSDYESKLPENQFLLEYGFVDEKLRLVDDDGRLIDSSGKHIDENGRFIKWTGKDTFEYVDIEGRTVTKKGDYKPEGFKPFFDKDGKPVLPRKKATPSA
jgi:hypothetical protein